MKKLDKVKVGNTVSLREIEIRNRRAGKVTDLIKFAINNPNKTILLSGIGPEEKELSPFAKEIQSVVERAFPEHKDNFVFKVLEEKHERIGYQSIFYFRTPQ